MSTPKDFMRIALSKAQEALDQKEVPVGCVFVHDSKVLATGINQTNISLNVCFILFILGDQTCRNGSHRSDIQRNTRRSNDCRIYSFHLPRNWYVTVEPCIMCAAALRQLGIRRVYFGCGNDRFGGNGTVLALNSDHHEDYPPYEVVSGIFRKEAIILLRSFYIQENDHAPEPKKKCNRVLKIDDI